MEWVKYLSETRSEPKKVPPVKLLTLFQVFATVGAISFGGGAIAYLREYVVRAKNWMTDQEFLDALEISETLPGLNSVNLSVIIGDRMRGAIGAFVAVCGIIAPGALVVLGLADLWEGPLHSPQIGRFLAGVAAAACGLLVAVTLQLGRRQLTRLNDLIIVAVTFVAVAILNMPLWLVVLLVAPAAIWIHRPKSSAFRLSNPGITASNQSNNPGS